MARRLNEARDALAEAQQVREDAIVAAYHAGGGMNEIAEEVGMTYRGVAKMLTRLGVRKVPETMDEMNADRDRMERGRR